MTTPRAWPVGTGWIEVITGCMFSGKTEELVRRLHLARYANQRIRAFRPAVDPRSAAGDGRPSDVPFVAVHNTVDVLKEAGDAQVIGIDEAQFFDESLVHVVDRLANEGRRVIVAGLDQDYRGIPFEPIPELMALAEYVTKTLAVCRVCGAPANRSQRLGARDQRVVLGATEIYEARCRLHWHPDRLVAQQQQLPLHDSE